MQSSKSKAFLAYLEAQPRMERAEKFVIHMEECKCMDFASFYGALRLCFLHHLLWIFVRLHEIGKLSLCEHFIREEWKQILDVTWIMDNSQIIALLWQLPVMCVDLEMAKHCSMKEHGEAIGHAWYQRQISAKKRH